MTIDREAKGFLVTGEGGGDFAPSKSIVYARILSRKNQGFGIFSWR